MAQYSAVCEAGAGDASFPFAGLYAPSGSGLILREVKCFSIGTAAARVRLRRATTAGTWTAEEEIEWNEDGPPPLATAVKSAITTAPTMGDPFDVGGIGAAAGSGFVYSYYGEGRGLYVPPGTGNGIVLIETADTANTYDVTFIWDE